MTVVSNSIDINEHKEFVIQLCDSVGVPPNTLDHVRMMLIDNKKITDIIEINPRDWDLYDVDVEILQNHFCLYDNDLSTALDLYYDLTSC